MAYEIGVASSYLDLAAKLRTFLTSNSTLAGLGQTWDQIGGETGALEADDFISLRGPGLTGTDEILVTLKLFSDVGGNYHNLAVRGHTAYNESLPSDTPLGVNSGWAPILLGNSAISYWFVANGRRFIVITKFNSRYDVMYAGFILPEHLPTDWSYPLFVGGSCWAQDSSASNSGWSHSNFWFPIGESNSGAARSSAYIFAPMQSWLPIMNGYSDNAYNSPHRCTFPWAAQRHNFKRLLDGAPWIQRGQLFVAGHNGGYTPEGGMLYGSFDGVYYTPSDGATSEQIITVDGKDYIIVQNVFRTDLGRFAAIGLE